MAKKLVIVESPAKARTIRQFLDSDYEVKASIGHIRDLPESKEEIPEDKRKLPWAKLGVDVHNGFAPLYVTPLSKAKQASELQKAARGKETILLATDEDREGESISWHVLQLLNPPKKTKVQRIVFHEVTPEAIRFALDNPRDLDENLFKAQETRRILDRLVGYSLSPVLWKKVAPKLSAGRVQSVAVRLVVMRERERRDFREAEYWGIQARLKSLSGELDMTLEKIGDQTLAEGSSFNSLGQLERKKAFWLKGEQAIDLAPALAASRPWTVTSVEKKPGTERPPEPFMTSTLQQEANRKLGFSAQRTMRTAQQLYEGIDLGSGSVGLITYMRTDSLTLAERALSEARQVIGDLYGKEYLPAQPKRYKSKSKLAQEAHEAIRPTDLARRPQDLRMHLTDDQFKLYDLIWKRTIACQMVPAQVERTKLEASVGHGGVEHRFAASGKSILFPGFLRAYVEGTDDPTAELGDRETILPSVSVGEVLQPVTVKADQKFTRPPARYTQASLVKELEEQGVGRPSTYASILNTIQTRGYVFERKKELIPTFTAFAVTELLENHFHELVDLRFTAKMEDELDEIAEGKANSVDHLTRFYFGEPEHPGLIKQIDERQAGIPFPSLVLGVTDAGEEVAVRIGRTGPFIRRGEGGPGHTASIPDDVAPAELDLEAALDLLNKKNSAPPTVGTDPASGRPVFLRKGRFGEYIEVEPTEQEQATGTKPKRASLPPDLAGQTPTAEDVELLLRFPREVGATPDGEPVTVSVGRYGAFIQCGARKGNYADWRRASAFGLEEAMKALESGGLSAGGGRPAAPTPIREFGELDGAAGVVKLMNGRFGPYVTDGKTNATLPKGILPEQVSAEQALELLKKKAAAGPSKRPKRFARKKPAGSNRS